MSEAPTTSAKKAVAVEPVSFKPGEIPTAGPTILERAAANQEQARQAKIAALRAAKVQHTTNTAEPKVTVRVLKKGHGQISMGEHVNGLGDLTYDHGETFELVQSIALELEDRGLVEIQ
jgi:hypothetical protein